MDYRDNDCVVVAHNNRMLSSAYYAHPFTVFGSVFNAAQVLNGGRNYSPYSFQSAPTPPPLNIYNQLSSPLSSTTVDAPPVNYYIPTNSKESSCRQRMNSISGTGLSSNYINSVDQLSILHPLSALLILGKLVK
jgi:hypothetical protein